MSLVLVLHLPLVSRLEGSHSLGKVSCRLGVHVNLAPRDLPVPQDLVIEKDLSTSC